MTDHGGAAGLEPDPGAPPGAPRVAPPVAPGPSPERPRRRFRRFRRFRFTLKLLAVVALLYYALSTVIPGARNAVGELRNVNPLLILTGFALELMALYSYSLLTRAALGDDAPKIASWRMFRIQMSTKALSSIVPGGSAAGSALGYRLMTLSGVPGSGAGFALATSGLLSAVVLNLIFWASLIVSIPIRGVNAGYATGAIAGVIVMGFAAVLVFGLLEGQSRAERILRWIARKLRLDEDRAAEGVRHIGGRLEDLAGDRQLLGRVAGWAAANWLLDAAALWVFLRAFGESADVDALLVSFGLVNVLAVVPVTPGGLGISELALPSSLVGFGLTRSTAVLGVAAWRLAQFFFPILLGGLLYASLRIGPWSIQRRDRLARLRDLAREEAAVGESAFDFAVRFGLRPPSEVRAEPGVTAMDETDEFDRDEPGDPGTTPAP